MATLQAGEALRSAAACAGIPALCPLPSFCQRTPRTGWPSTAASSRPGRSGRSHGASLTAFTARRQSAALEARIVLDRMAAMNKMLGFDCEMRPGHSAHVGLSSHLPGRKRFSRSWASPSPRLLEPVRRHHSPRRLRASRHIETPLPSRHRTLVTLRPRPLATGAVSTPSAAGDAEASAYGRRRVKP